MKTFEITVLIDAKLNSGVIKRVFITSRAPQTHSKWTDVDIDGKVIRFFHRNIISIEWERK